MPKQVLIIGNSHNASVYNAYKKMYPISGCEVSFLSSDGESLLSITDFGNPNSMMKVHKKGQGYSKKFVRDLKEYESIFVYGLRLRSWLNGNNNWLNIVRESSMFFSSAARTQAYQDYIRGSANYRILEKLKSQGLQNRTVSMPCPYPGEREEIDVTPDENNLELFNRIMEEEITKLGFGFLDTPSELNSNLKFFTDQKFKNNTVGDYNHLNIHGGNIVLEKMLLSIEITNT